MSDKTTRLVTGQAISVTTRMRVENGFTLSGGHGYSSTVEVTWTASEEDLEVATDIAQEQLHDALERARVEGTRERDKRNKADGR